MCDMFTCMHANLLKCLLFNILSMCKPSRKTKVPGAPMWGRDTCHVCGSTKNICVAMLRHLREDFTFGHQKPLTALHPCCARTLTRVRRLIAGAGHQVWCLFVYHCLVQLIACPSVFQGVTMERVYLPCIPSAPENTDRLASLLRQDAHTCSICACASWACGCFGVE